MTDDEGIEDGMDEDTEVADTSCPCAFNSCTPGGKDVMLPTLDMILMVFWAALLVNVEELPPVILRVCMPF